MLKLKTLRFRSKHASQLPCAVALTLFLAFGPTTPLQAEVLDAVVAVVDGEPITISDLEKYIGTPITHDLKKLSQDSEASSALKRMVEERVLENESRERKLSVSTEELDRYIKEIAARNNLSDAEFEVALQQEGTTLSKFREHTRFEILRTKLASSLLNREVAVSNEEVNKYFKENSQDSMLGEKIELAQIFLSSAISSPEQIEQKISDLQRILAESPDRFSELAKQYSDAPEAESGGKLPIFMTNELTPEILEAISDLQDGEVAEPLQSEDGYRIFQLIKRVSLKAEKAVLKKEIREKLRQEKVSAALQTFFMSDIYKRHTIDKKI
jgi:peptidyl-prolyl cis-trans isomerase SurA